MRIALLHTADVHVAAFDTIFNDLGCDVQLEHHVDASLLDRARQDGIGAVRADVAMRLAALSDADAVLCTCSTLGPLVDEMGMSPAKIIRIDRPLMEQTCASGGKVLVALCLDSTRDATLDLLADCAKKAGQVIVPIVVICKDAWVHFEAGDMNSFARAIVASVEDKLQDEPDITRIVLAQASMRVAEAALVQTGLPVLSSPVIAAQRCIDVAKTNADA